MPQLINSLLVPASSNHYLLQVGEATEQATEQAVEQASNVLESLQTIAGQDALNIIKAIGILVVGWIVALICKSIIRGLLNKTEIDNKIATWVSGGDKNSDIPVENWLANAIYWFVILFTVVAVLQTLQLEAVSAPLNDLLSQVTNFLPKLLAAGVWLGVAWLVATVVKLIVTKGLGSVNIDERLNQELSEDDGKPLGVTDTIGNTLYWLVFFFFLIPVLETLGLESTLDPLKGLIDEVFTYLPNLFSAALIGLVGWFVAQIIRRIVTNLLKATGVDQVGERFGLSKDAGRQSLSWLLGTIAYIFVLIPIAIAALTAASIQAISDPAINMLNQVMNYFPQALGGLIIITLAYGVGQVVAEQVAKLLTGFGFDNVLAKLGLDSLLGSQPSVEPQDAESETVATAKTPSQWMGDLVLVAIMAIAVFAFVDILDIESLSLVMQEILAVAINVFAFLLIVTIGLFFSNLAVEFISKAGTKQSMILAQAARVVILVLAAAMALDRLGVAPNIVNLAFGLLTGGIALAIAIAFGWGGKDVAGEQLKKWVDNFNE